MENGLTGVHMELVLRRAALAPKQEKEPVLIQSHSEVVLHVLVPQANQQHAMIKPVQVSYFISSYSY